MIEYIAREIVYGVNWPLVFYAVLAIGLCELIVKRWRLSPIHWVLEILTEIFRERGRGAIDGAITYALIAFTLLVILFTHLDEYFHYLSVLRTGVETPEKSSYLILMMFFGTGVIGLLSLVATKRDS